MFKGLEDLDMISSESEFSLCFLSITVIASLCLYALKS